ncbi:hypothetical protein DKT68_15135 [Micromonospora acroterricola]|uniref:Uncharacterized protein n=1 Tax=Micromonospora acroterricola TaxID=2202421 RepID=A0A317D1H6_9ACTN|nr:hypothetical protein [Micromonospora acroterricola]PWR08549.1 hypothetical protein DKT68_15135 [Micromonospora acroterricola]
MHNPFNPDRTLRWARNASAVIAASIASLRVADAIDVILLPEVVSVAAIAPFIASVVTAVGCGYRIKARRLERDKASAEKRAKYAEWENVRLRRQETLLDGEEDKELWDSVPAASNMEDTCAFGTQVVVLDQRRRPWGQQAG